MALTSAALSFNRAPDCSIDALGTLEKMRCAARRLGIPVTSLAATGMQMTFTEDEQPLSPDVHFQVHPG
jgi:hypothetical protein